MEPYTFTFEDVGSKAPSGAGLMGKPRRFPTKYGCGVGDGCCASSTPVATPTAMVTAPVSKVIRVIRHPPPGRPRDDSARGADLGDLFRPERHHRVHARGAVRREPGRE